MTPEFTAVWGKTLVDELKHQGFSDEQIVGNTGIRLSALQEDAPRIKFDQLALLFERAAELTNDDLIGFKHGQNREFRRLGLFYYVSASSPTLRTLLHELSRFERLLGDALQRNPAKLNDGVIEWRFSVPRAVKRQQYLEFQATATVDALRRLTGRNLRLEGIHFRHHRVGNDAPMRTFFGCGIEFGSDENRIVLKPSDLDLPLLSADDHLYRLMVRYSEEAIGKLSASKPSLVHLVEEAVAKDPTATQTEIAKKLGMSVRTLSRKLTAEDTSYSEVLDGYREAMAKSMIDGSEMSLTEIAFVLGYADLSSFSTAFRRWVGKSPKEYRDRNF